MVVSSTFVRLCLKGQTLDHLRTTFQFEETLSIFGGFFALYEMIHE